MEQEMRRVEVKKKSVTSVFAYFVSLNPQNYPAKWLLLLHFTIEEIDTESLQYMHAKVNW